MTEAQANTRLRRITGDIRGYVSRGTYAHTQHDRIDRWYWNDGSHVVKRDYEGALTLEELVEAHEELMRNDR
jgi:hypothetical protein